MKFLLPFSFLLFAPLILFAFLFAAILPLFLQRFFDKKSVANTPVYPYLTSWEEAA